MAYVKGQTVELPVTFTVTSTGVLADPTVVRLTTVAPDGTTTTYTYPAPEIIRDSTGTYRGIIVTNDDGEWRYEWQSTGTAGGVQDGSFTVRPSVVDQPPALSPTYCTVQQLRDELGIDDETLTDREAAALIQSAEDLIDEDLGARQVNDITGRKVIQGDVDAWRWTKLNTATVRLAALLFRQPAITDPTRQYRTVRGPDFEFTGPIGSRFGPSVDAPLNQSGLRRLTTTVGHRRDLPPWHNFVVNDTSWDYDPPPLPRQT